MTCDVHKIKEPTHPTFLLPLIGINVFYKQYSIIHVLIQRLPVLTGSLVLLFHLLSDLSLWGTL